MLEYLWKEKANPRTFGGTIGSSEAELSSGTIDQLHMRPALLRFAKQLAKQYKGFGRKPTQYSEGTEIIGVQLHAITFTLVTQSIPKPK